jgi:thioredoxin-dependent peroxiredoxin
MLAAGSLAPDFCLPDQHGNEVCLAEHRGRWVLLWWYPKAESPGCTVEGQVLRDNAAAFEAAHCAILGASFDTPAENLAFATAQGFDFPLLSDADRKVGEAYQVVRQADHQYAIYPRRHSFLIDGEGVVRRVYVVTDVAVHATEVLADLAGLQR